jgi:hypothetical protein
MTVLDVIIVFVPGGEMRVEGVCGSGWKLGTCGGDATGAHRDGNGSRGRVQNGEERHSGGADPAIVAVPGRLKPMHATDATPVFLNTDGRAIYGDSFAKHEWHRARRATGVCPRKFYSTRHSFISLALSDGRPPQWVAEYVGTSLAMLQEHYAAFIKNPAADSMLSFLGALGECRVRVSAKTARNTSRNSGFRRGPADYLGFGSSLEANDQALKSACAARLEQGSGVHGPATRGMLLNLLAISAAVGPRRTFGTFRRPRRAGSSRPPHARGVERFEDAQAEHDRLHQMHAQPEHRVGMSVIPAAVTSGPETDGLAQGGKLAAAENLGRQREARPPFVSWRRVQDEPVIDRTRASGCSRRRKCRRRPGRAARARRPRR